MRVVRPIALTYIMTIRPKDSINKQLYEAMGQASMFGHDSLQFKTVNHPLKHKLVELCSELKLKLSYSLSNPNYSLNISK